MPTLSPNDPGWNFVGNDAFGDVSRFASAATNGATTVVTGELVIAPARALTQASRTRLGDEFWTTWSTTDGLTWRVADFWAGLESRDLMEIGVVAFGQGFAAYASSTENASGMPTTSFFLSSNGHDWEQTGQLEGYEVTALASTGQALVALAVDFDGQGTIWLSSDGASWRQSADADAPPIATGGEALTAYGGTIAALTATPDGMEVWITADGDSWDRAARLPESLRAGMYSQIEAAMAAGAAGWSILAIDLGKSIGPLAWHSVDSTDWQEVASPPNEIDYPALVGFDGGFVATDFIVNAPCCVYEPHDIEGVTWSSPDGTTWTELSGRGWKARRIEVLVMRSETLLGLGIDWSAVSADDVTAAGRGALWIADPWTFVSSGPAPTNSPDPREVLISPEDAIERVTAFVGDPDATSDLTVRAPTDGTSVGYYVVDGQSLAAGVNANDGTIISLILFGHARVGPPTIDADEAIEVAERFLNDHDIPFDGLDRSVEFADHGDTSEHVVEWLGHSGEVLVPNSRLVGVDAASGQVFRYSYVNHPYSLPPTPTVDQAAAEQAAIQVAAGSASAQIDRSELVITFTSDEVQRLVWRVYVTVGIAHAIVEVDAETGAATVTGRG